MTEKSLGWPVTIKIPGGILLEGIMEPALPEIV